MIEEERHVLEKKAYEKRLELIRNNKLQEAKNIDYENEINANRPKHFVRLPPKLFFSFFTFFYWSVYSLDP